MSLLHVPVRVLSFKQRFCFVKNRNPLAMKFRCIVFSGAHRSPPPCLGSAVPQSPRPESRRLTQTPSAHQAALLRPAVLHPAPKIESKMGRSSKVNFFFCFFEEGDLNINYLKSFFRLRRIREGRDLPHCRVITSLVRPISLLTL